MIPYDEYPPEVIIALLNATHDHFEKGGPIDTCPYEQHEATERVKHMKIEFEEQRNGLVLIQALRECAKHEIPMPDWAAKVFLEQTDKILNFEARSWDDVFGKPYKRIKLADQRKRKKNKNRVYWAVMQYMQANPSTPIDGNLFEKIGKELGICKTLASEHYYEKKKELDLCSSMKADALKNIAEFSERQDKWLETYGHRLKFNRENSAK